VNELYVGKWGSVQQTGDYDDVRIFDYTISSDEVAAIYSGPTSSYGYVDGVSGTALSFNGSQAVNCGNVLLPSESMSIAFTLTPGDMSVRRNPWDKAYGGEGAITQETDGQINYFYGTAGSNDQPYQAFGTPANTVSSGNTYRVMIVRDLDAMKLRWYIDGALVSEADADYSAATASTDDMLIGNGYTNPYDGWIDELRIWDRALTAEEAWVDYAAEIPKVSARSSVRTAGRFPSTPAAGDTIYRNDTGLVYEYTGTNWIGL
jgi:hypothetical protein